MNTWAEAAKPKSLFGMLSKMSPGWLINTWQKRFFILQDGVLYWSTSAVTAVVGPEGLPGLRGRVDLIANPGCTVTFDAPTNQFSLRPPEGGWLTHGFTGAEQGRVITLDAGGKDPSREQWVEALHAHMAYAAKVRVASRGAKGIPPGTAKGEPPHRGAASAGAKEPELNATEAAKAAHRNQVEARRAAEARRADPLIRDATEAEIVASLMGPRPSEILREELDAEEILCQ